MFASRFRWKKNILAINALAFHYMVKDVTRYCQSKVVDGCTLQYLLRILLFSSFPEISVQSVDGRHYQLSRISVQLFIFQLDLTGHKLVGQDWRDCE